MKQSCTVRLLIIDPQNDFCDIPGAALPVTGADADMRRLATFMQSARTRIGELIVTLDSHPSVAIERTTFWVTSNGEPVAPYTEITLEAVETGRFIPRGALSEGEREGDRTLVTRVMQYLKVLEAGGRYRLCVWPVHCVLGTWGHNVHEAVAKEVNAWEEAHQRTALKVLKGMNPMTEQYSAVCAEVPDLNDPLSQTNHKLIGRAKPGMDELLIVAGEAASHCVAATMEHLLEAFTNEERARVVVLKDCMSQVTGFEAQTEKFFDAVRRAGGRVLTSQQALALIA